MALPTECNIHYTIEPIQPEAHLFQIDCIIEKPDPDGQVLSMPNWIPGSYMIRDFAKNIVTIIAIHNGQSVELRKIDKSHWQIAPCQGPIHIQYQVYAWDLSVRTAHLDTTHGYFNGTSVFIAVEGQEDAPCSVTLKPPAGEQYKEWRVATTLPRAKAELYAFGEYYAPNYDELIDHPVEMGTFTLASFDVSGVPHDIAITGIHYADMERLTSDLQKICQSHVDMFGELPQMERYLFQVMVVGDGYGGLEHRSSTSLLCSRKDLPVLGQDELTDSYRSFLGLCSHEYFHTWNVKRIKPEAYLPYSLDSESYTEQLWAFEGITSYYDDLGLLRSGVITTGNYLELLGQMITRVIRGTGRFKQSVADSSFYTWTKFYKQDESAPNNIVSYYTKGALLALGLDLTIRIATNHQKSLDDVMRYLWLTYGKPGIGVPEGKIEKIASEITGKDLSDYFENYLYKPNDIPLNALLDQVGIEYQLRHANGLDDLGGKPGDGTHPLYFGARMIDDPQGVKLTHVFDSGPAQKSGLSAGDTVIAIDKVRVTRANLTSTLALHGAGKIVDIAAFRRDELFHTKMVIELTPPDTVYLLEQDKDKSAPWLNHK